MRSASMISDSYFVESEITTLCLVEVVQQIIFILLAMLQSEQRLRMLHAECCVVDCTWAALCVPLTIPLGVITRIEQFYSYILNNYWLDSDNIFKSCPS